MGQAPHESMRAGAHTAYMREFHGTATAFVDATPESVFDLITDIDRLPDWNSAIESVVATPAELAKDSEWVVVIKPAGLPRWHSRSTVLDINRRGLRFAYRSQSDDGNASYIEWMWHITAVDGGAQVDVAWDAHPMTFWRRVLLAPFIRRPQLSKEVPASLDALNQQVSRRSNV
jgi:uncharacterized protein YndB with AHSA1/START domain